MKDWTKRKGALSFLVVCFIILMSNTTLLKKLQTMNHINKIQKIEKKMMWTENKESPAVTKTFIPAIRQEIENPKEYYKKGDTVSLKIIIMNQEMYPIYDVVVKSNNSEVEFTRNNNYKIQSENSAKITKIAPAEQITMSALYQVKSNDLKDITSNISIINAKADNGYVLNTTLPNSTLTFKVGNISLTIVNKETNISKENAIFGLYRDSNCQELIEQGLIFNNLQPNTTYYLKEITPPTGCIVYKDILAVEVNNEGKIQFRKVLSNQGIHYRKEEDKSDTSMTQTEGDAILTLTRTAINILPHIKSQGNLSYIIVGLILIMSSIGYYIYYITRKKAV